MPTAPPSPSDPAARDAKASACPVCAVSASTHFARMEGRDYRRCPACEATFLDPAQRLAQAEEHEHYRLHRNDVDDSGYRGFLSRLATPLLTKLAPGAAGLDYGCGPGPALAAMLTEAGHDMTLYDPLFRDDRSVLDRTYDFITCTEVAEHFHHPRDEFERLDGLLKPGGWLAVMTSFQSDADDFARWHYRRDPTHVVFYREATFRVIARQRRWHGEFPVPNVALLHKAD